MSDVSAIAELLAKTVAQANETRRRRQLQDAYEETRYAFAAAWEAMVGGIGREADCHAAADKLHELRAQVAEEGE